MRVHVWASSNRLISVLPGSTKGMQVLSDIWSACTLCQKAHEERGSSWKGELPKETISHIQSAGCLGQREKVIAAHNAWIRELLQEVKVRESGSTHQTLHN